jgi:hypothetical protein
VKPLLVLVLGAAAAAACGTTASDATNTTLSADNGPASHAVIAPNRPVNREVVIPAGTALALVLTNSMASDTSAVDDAVSAELTGRSRLTAATCCPSARG